MDYQWYPGHMTKAMRQMKEDIKLIDLVIELLDARIPISSRNPDIDNLGKNKARLVLLNKSDLADEAQNNKWIQYFKDKGIIALKINSKNKQGIKDINNAVLTVCKEKIERDKRKGIKNRPVRAMVVGIPNVGKSTFLSIVSDARPKIANYHFTTLQPNLGVVNMGDGSFVVADIPGIIEGAHEGVGLGHEFLRHVERTKLLLHVVDVSGIEGRNPIEDFDTINNELKLYSEKLAQKRQIVLANKSDIPGFEENYEAFKKEMEDRGYTVFKISAATKAGISEVLKYTYEILSKIPDEEFEEEYEMFDLESDRKADDTITVSVEDGVYHVEGRRAQFIVGSTNMEDYESLQYFQRALIKSGVIDKLKEAGIQDGDPVEIYGCEFDYVE